MNKYIVVGGEAVLDFTYDRFEEKETLIVRLPERLTFNLHFFIQMNILIKECLNSDDVNRIIIRSPKFINYAKMTMAYIINTLTYINEQSGKKIYINNYGGSYIYNLFSSFFCNDSFCFGLNSNT